MGIKPNFFLPIQYHYPHLEYQNIIRRVLIENPHKIDTRHEAWRIVSGRTALEIFVVAEAGDPTSHNQPQQFWEPNLLTFEPRRITSGIFAYALTQNPVNYVVCIVQMRRTTPVGRPSRPDLGRRQRHPSIFHRPSTHPSHRRGDRCRVVLWMLAGPALPTYYFSPVYSFYYHQFS